MRFLEDIKHNIMPIGGRSSNRAEFSIKIEPNNTSYLQRLLLNAIPGRYIDFRGNLTEGVSQFIEELAVQVAYKGKAYYEIIRYSESEKKPENEVLTQNEEDTTTQIEEDTAKIGQFIFVPIHGRVVRIGNYYIQVTPYSTWSRKTRKYVILPKESIWSIRIPPYLGNSSKQRKMLRGLANEKYSVSSAIRDNIPYRRDHYYISLFRETKQWGGFSHIAYDKANDFYLVYRDLRFALSMAILREHIVSSVNTLLIDMGFPGQLSITGLPSAKDIRGYIDDLQSQKILLKDARELIRF
jgi:hypothetical protein